MALPTTAETLKNPDFLALPSVEKKRVLVQIEPQFASLSEEEQNKAVLSLDPATVDQKSANELARQQIIEREQQPTSEKVVDIAKSIPNIISDLLSKGYSGVTSLPQLITNPSSIIPTGAEAVRRIGFDAAAIGRDLGEAQLKRMARDPFGVITGASSGPAGLVQELVGQLRSRTPSEAEIAIELGLRPGKELIQAERTQNLFEGAQPEVAEGLATYAPLFAPGPKFLRSTAARVPPVISATKAAVLPTKTVVSGLSNVWDVAGRRGAAKFEDLVESTKSDTILSELKKTKVPENLKEFVDIHAPTKKRLGSEVDDYLSKRGDAFSVETPTPDEIVSNIQGQTLITAEQGTAIKDILAKEGIGQQMTLKQSIDLQRRINAKYNKILENSNYNLDIASQNPLFQAYDQVRRRISVQADNIITGDTGVEFNPYRTYGLIEESENLARSRYQSLFRNAQQEIEERGLRDTFKQIDITKPATWINVPKVGAELKSADKSVGRIFEKVKPVKPVQLTQEQIADRLSGRLREPPVIPESASSIAVQAARDEALRNEIARLVQEATRPLP